MSTNKYQIILLFHWNRFAWTICTGDSFVLFNWVTWLKLIIERWKCIFAVSLEKSFAAWLFLWTNLNFLFRMQHVNVSSLKLYYERTYFGYNLIKRNDLALRLNKLEFLWPKDGMCHFSLETTCFNRYKNKTSTKQYQVDYHFKIVKYAFYFVGFFCNLRPFSSNSGPPITSNFNTHPDNLRTIWILG